MKYNFTIYLKGKTIEDYTTMTFEIQSLKEMKLILIEYQDEIIGVELKKKGRALKR